MKDDKELRDELNKLSDEAMKITEELCNKFKEFDSIQTGEPTEEEQEKYGAFLMETDRRRAMILRRILIEYGGLLYI